MFVSAMPSVYSWRVVRAMMIDSGNDIHPRSLLTGSEWLACFSAVRVFQSTGRGLVNSGFCDGFWSPFFYFEMFVSVGPLHPYNYLQSSRISITMPIAMSAGILKSISTTAHFCHKGNRVSLTKELAMIAVAHKTRNTKNSTTALSSLNIWV